MTAMFWKKAAAPCIAGEDVNPVDEFRYVGPDGKLRWFEIHRTRTPGSLQVVGLIQDITERKQSLEALTASEARLELAASAARIGIWDWDLLSGRMIYCPRAKAISGFAPRPELTLADVQRVTHPDRPAGHLRAGSARARPLHPRYQPLSTIASCGPMARSGT